MLQKLNWEAYSNADRNIVIEEVKDIISANDGSIMNFKMFSDFALSLSIEIEEDRIVELHKALSATLKISDFDSANINPNSKRNWLVFMNIAFSGGRGALKMEVPAVPG